MRHGSHHGRPEVRVLSGTRFEIRTRKTRSVNTDGEMTTTTPARFRVLPGAIEVFVPEEKARPSFSEEKEAKRLCKLARD